MLDFHLVREALTERDLLINRLAPHLVKRSYSEPHWEKKQGAVMAFEKVTLYGLPIVPRRKVGYSKVDPVASRELFIRHALVEGDWESQQAFDRANRTFRKELEQIEERSRRRDLLTDDEAVFGPIDLDRVAALQRGPDDARLFALLRHRHVLEDVVDQHLARGRRAARLAGEAEAEADILLQRQPRQQRGILERHCHPRVGTAQRLAE